MFISNKITISDLFTYYGKKFTRLDVLKKFINVVGANEHNLQNVSVQIPRDKLTVITGLSGSESPPWPLILFMQKGKENMSKAYPLMLDNFLDSYKNQTLNTLMDFRPRFQLSSEHRVLTRDLLLLRQLKFTITLD